MFSTSFFHSGIRVTRLHRKGTNELWSVSVFLKAKGADFGTGHRFSGPCTEIPEKSLSQIDQARWHFCPWHGRAQAGIYLPSDCPRSRCGNQNHLKPGAIQDIPVAVRKLGFDRVPEKFMTGPGTNRPGAQRRGRSMTIALSTSLKSRTAFKARDPTRINRQLKARARWLDSESLVNYHKPAATASFGSCFAPLTSTDSTSRQRL